MKIKESKREYIYILPTMWKWRDINDDRKGKDYAQHGGKVRKKLSFGDRDRSADEIASSVVCEGRMRMCVYGIRR